MATLSKSDYRLGRPCAVQLYHRKRGVADGSERDEYVELLKEGGYMVEALAKALRPDGVTVPYEGDPVAAAAATLALLQQPDVTLFEATLLHEGRLARADIIERRGDTVYLLEVKAKSFDRAEHTTSLDAGGAGAFRGKRDPSAIQKEWEETLHDVTFQVLVLERLLPGVTVEPMLVLVDRSATTTVEALPLKFEKVMARGADGVERLQTVRFTGDRAALDGVRELLCEVDVSEEVALLRGEVDAIARSLERVVTPPLIRPDVPIGVHCAKCEFGGIGDAGDAATSGFRACWGDKADVAPHVLSLYKASMAGGKTLVNDLIGAGKVSLFDVPTAALTKKDGSRGADDTRRLVQIEHTKRGTVWIDPPLGATIKGVTYPLHFIDFETSRMALPHHPGQRPYGLVAFQWSCHTIAAPGADPVHSAWINRSELWPNETFARTLRTAVGTTGTVLSWAVHEVSTLREVAAALAAGPRPDPALGDWLTTMDSSRILDMNALTLKHFFHPGMAGRTSIKVVLKALWESDSAMRDQFARWTGRRVEGSDSPYSALPAVAIAGVDQSVQEGTGAILAYNEMMYGAAREDAKAKDSWARLLEQYCELDTLAMVLIWEYWRRSLDS